MSHFAVVAPLQNAAAEAAAAQAQAQANAALAQARVEQALAQHQGQLSPEQAQAIRDAVQAARDAAQSARDAARPMMPPPMFDRAARRKEGMTFVGFVIVVIAAVAVLRPIMRAIGKRIEGAPQRDALASGASTERLERIEQAVEAMAVEIERISEGQRFTTKLLSARADADATLVRRG